MSPPTRKQKANRSQSRRGERFRLQRDRAGGNERDLTALRDAVGGERHDCGDQEDEADHRAHFEVLLADHLLVDVGREDIELAADHLRDPEIGDDEREDHERRAHQAVLCTRQRHGEEHARL